MRTAYRPTLRIVYQDGSDVDDALVRAGREERERDEARREVAEARTGYMDAL